MTLTIRGLVAETDLRLVVRGDPRGLEQEVRWVAVSELPDPTPWIQGAELLLTSGMWLREAKHRGPTADEWAARLAASGARAVGFGLEPWFSAVPAEVVDAATRHRLTVLEVPPGTPFVAIDRRVADLHAAEARRREADLVRSQQRLAAAARSGRSAVVRTLSRELGGWVVTLDAGHRIDDRAGDLDGADEAEVAALAARAAREACRSLLAGHPTRPVYRVPVGDADNRRGTLCVDGRSVVAFAAQRAGLVGAAAALLSVLSPLPDTSLRLAVGELLMEGEVEPATRVCRVAGVPLPDPLVAVVLGGKGRSKAAARALEVGMWPAPDGRGDAGTVLFGAPEAVEARLADLLEMTGARAGVSGLHGAVDLRRAVQEAVGCLRRTSGEKRLVSYGQAAAPALASVLQAEPTRGFAAALLAPLDGHPHRDTLLASAAAWVQAHGRWDPAAAALGVHRVTLRARMSRLCEALGLDLDVPRDRLALTLALEAGAGTESPPSPASTR